MVRPLGGKGCAARMAASEREQKEKAVQFIKEGDLLLERGRLFEAIGRYRMATELDSRDPQCRTRLADAYAYADQTLQAAAEYEHALRIAPNCAEAHFGLGELFFNYGRIRAAIHYFARAVRLNPGKAWYHYRLSQAYIQAGRLEKAERALKRAIRLMPNSFYLFKLGDLYVQMHRLEEAKRALELSCVSAPWDEYYYACLGLLRWRLKDMGGAVEALTKAASLQPGVSSYRYLLAEALASAGEEERAEEQFQQASSLDEYDKDLVRRLKAWAGLEVRR